MRPAQPLMVTERKEGSSFLRSGVPMPMGSETAPAGGDTPEGAKALFAPSYPNGGSAERSGIRRERRAALPIGIGAERSKSKVATFGHYDKPRGYSEKLPNCGSK